MTTETKKPAGTIDITPKWRGIVPLLIAGITEGTDEGRKIAIQELYRLADFVDGVNAEPDAAERAAFMAGYTAGCVVLSGEEDAGAAWNEYKAKQEAETNG